MPFFRILILSPHLELSFLLVECKLICYVPLPFFHILILFPRLELSCFVPLGIGALQASLTNLGVTPDCHLTMKAHKFNLVRSANFEPRRISAIRHLLSTDAKTVFVSLRLCSDTLWLHQFSPVCLSSVLLTQTTRKVENYAARLTLRIPQTDHN